MEISKFITPFLCFISPFALGWTVFCLIFVIRGDWKAGARLFVLGLGLVGVLLAYGAVVYFLPDWAAVVFLLMGAFLPWLSVLRYLIRSKYSGKLLMALPTNNQKWSMSILSGAFSVLFGLQILVLHNRFLTPAKSYALGIALISLGVFKVIQRIRYAQIREMGILSELGGFYKWENIENYVWKFGEDKLSLQLRKAIFKKNVNVKILSQFRHEVVNHLSQNVRVDESNSKGYVPIEKAG